MDSLPPYESKKSQVSNYSNEERNKPGSSSSSYSSSSKYESDNFRPPSPYSNWLNRRRHGLSATSSKSSQEGDYTMPHVKNVHDDCNTVPAQVMNRLKERRSHSLDDRTAAAFPLTGRPSAMRTLLPEQEGRSWSNPTPSVKLPPILSKQVRFQAEQRQSLGAYRIMKRQESS